MPSALATSNKTTSHKLKTLLVCNSDAHIYEDGFKSTTKFSFFVAYNNLEENFPNWFSDLHNLHLLGYSKQ